MRLSWRVVERVSTSLAAVGWIRSVFCDTVKTPGWFVMCLRPKKKTNLFEVALKLAAQAMKVIDEMLLIDRRRIANKVSQSTKRHRIFAMKMMSLDTARIHTNPFASFTFKMLTVIATFPTRFQTDRRITFHPQPHGEHQPKQPEQGSENTGSLLPQHKKNGN
jgi:hypothetical protein